MEIQTLLVRVYIESATLKNNIVVFIKMKMLVSFNSPTSRYYYKNNSWNAYTKKSLQGYDLDVTVTRWIPDAHQ